MNLEDISAALACETLCTGGRDDLDIRNVVASDGMSQILACPAPHALMITGLTTIQSVRTAVVADALAIVYVRGKRPGDKVLQLARDKDLPVLCTPLGMFECCGILYEAGLKGEM